MTMPPPRRRRSTLVHALASRERGALMPHLHSFLPRVHWTMSQVLSPEDCAVLLGFSSDGNYLLYYSLWEASCTVQWKRISSPLSSSRPQLESALRLHVGKETASARVFGAPSIGSSLRVWQSPDDRLVAVIATDNHLASQDTGQTYHVSISPSPLWCDSHSAARTTSLSFSYTLPSPTQDIQSWQLHSIGHTSYLLTLNMGSSVILLAFRLVFQGFTQDISVIPSPLSRVCFGICDWYSPPEYPIEFKYTSHVRNNHTQALLATECVHQHEFDCEAFLSSFFHKYSAFRNLHLVDYDLQLARVHVVEKMLYMVCTADLESTPSISRQSIVQSRLALYFALDIYSGQYHVIRALKVPRQQSLRLLSSALARKFRGDLAERWPSDGTPTEWNNDPVVRGQPLRVLHNPRFPISIFSDEEVMGE